MSRTLFWGLFAIALALGLAFRLARLDLRPMHHDEANQAVRFGLLLETGDYRYDPAEHHGPTIYYLTVPFAWLRGQRTLASLDERTVRMVPALFGAGLILGLSLLARGLGRGAVAAAALLVAISPAFTYYSRFYIQESLFVLFTFGFLVALGRYALAPGMRAAIATGLVGGLAFSTKETSPIVFATCGAACVVARALCTRQGATDEVPGAECKVQGAECKVRAVHALAGLATALLVAALFYSSFFTNLPGLGGPVRSMAIYFERGMDAGGVHAAPWSYYLRTLAWSSSGGLVWTEALVLLLAVAGSVEAVRTRRRSFWPFYVCLYALFTAGVFAAIPYKTPWNLLPFHLGFVLLAGIGVARLLEPGTSRLVRGALIVLMVAEGAQLAVQDWRLNFKYPADPRNPYAYAQTSPDFVRLAGRVADLSAVHPDGRNMLVKVVAGPYEQWPLPWYLRTMPRVGYWNRAADAGALDGVPVIVASQQNAAAVEAAVGGRYVSEFYGLRPGVILSLYVERGLWGRFLASRR